ncbi:hypothetical protein DPEC_G00379480, partial [Dallia pectoralis]
MKGKWRQLTHGGRIIIEQKGQEAKLEIREITKSDSGQYRCVASNKNGEIECNTDIHVEEKKEVVGVEGDFRAKLKKTPSKQKSPQEEKDIDIVELLRNVDPKEYEKYARMYGITDYRGLLQAIEQLKREKAEESGRPETERERESDEDLAALVADLQKRMERTEPVTVNKDIADQSTTTKKTAVFECDIKINYPEITLSWYKGTQKLENNDKYEISIISDRHILKIKNCETKDQGNYRVVCGPHISSAKLMVIEPEVEKHLEEVAAEQIHFTKRIQNIVVGERQAATFECEVSFDNAIVSWYKDTWELKECPKYNFRSEGRRHFMIIHNVTSDDEGVYSVIVRLEPRGEAKSTAELYLSGKEIELAKVPHDAPDSSIQIPDIPSSVTLKATMGMGASGLELGAVEEEYETWTEEKVVQKISTTTAPKVLVEESVQIMKVGMREEMPQKVPEAPKKPQEKIKPAEAASPYE